MSSESSPTEILLPDPPEKQTWHANIKSSLRVYEAIRSEARREERSISYIVSRALEKYYELAKIKVL